MNAVLASQQTFRALLQAAAHPGSVVGIEADHGAPPPLRRACAAAALALFERDVTVWISGDVPDRARAWLRESSGVVLVESPLEANFGLVADGEALPDLERFDAGSADEPERSASLFVQVDALRGGEAVRLRGPGIDGEVVAAPCGLDPSFWRFWEANAAHYPRGLDAYLFSDDAVLALMRTTVVQR